MKKLKIDYLLLVALLMAGSAAVATRLPNQPKPNVLVEQWFRTAPSTNPDQEGGWQSGVAPEECRPSEKICSATFETGYNPNDHVDSVNVQNAIGSVQTGYILE
ncbi:hypothetical protein [Dyadobacter psychrotolerans]|uniref:Uncharacterized protein n=1 Tax=Dyadobacter psychrotolerans TaxID=2541721 RepID=A0A4R5D7Q6_9BACT|nr:hypothetical protein [Dyadobacter psychrotolerans]TDE09562.1 hypothetical protein E0F88_30200 [Dyadobacter psychrotolerans]